jgi:hypothetical protein
VSPTVQLRNKLLPKIAFLAMAALTAAAQGCAPPRSAQSLANVADSDYGNDRLARELRPAHEGPLATVAHVGAQPVYRMVRLGGWGGAGIIRVQQRGATWQVVVKVTDNEDKRQLRYADSATVISGQADSLVAVIARSHFWTRPAQTCRMGLDGYRVVLEARIGNDYYTINCWVPEEATAPAVVATMRAFERISGAAFPKSTSQPE